MKCYHGTTAENYQSIIADKNFKEADCTSWNCSEPNTTYVYPVYKIMKSDCLDTMEEAQERAIGLCFEQARLTASIQKSLSDCIYVLELDIPTDLLYNDYSCPNMEDIASEFYNSDIELSDHLTAVYKADYSPLTAFFNVAGLINNDYINLEKFSNYEISIMEHMNRNNIYLEQEYPEYQKIDCPLI